MLKPKEDKIGSLKEQLANSIVSSVGIDTAKDLFDIWNQFAADLKEEVKKVLVKHQDELKPNQPKGKVDEDAEKQKLKAQGPDSVRRGDK